MTLSRDAARFPARPETAEIYRKPGNLRAVAVQLLPRHTKVDSIVRSLYVALEEALNIAERIDI